MFQADLLQGKRILITGGGTGLGFSMGRRFLELGARLVICGRRAEVLREAAAKLAGEAGGKAPAQRASSVMSGCSVRTATRKSRCGFSTDGR